MIPSWVLIVVAFAIVVGLQLAVAFLEWREDRRSVERAELPEGSP